MIGNDEVTSEDIRFKCQLINKNLGLSNKRIARRLRVRPALFRSWMIGDKQIPESTYENLCQVADYAVYRVEYYRQLNKNDADMRIPIETANYIDKQVGMKKYRMGETILRNLAESPRTIRELQRIIKNNHRQSMSRKIQEMKENGVIFSSRWMDQNIKCWLRQGVRTYLIEVHWRPTNKQYV
jgi:transcriptional regulator with XRE-family HTH domain